MKGLGLLGKVAKNWNHSNRGCHSRFPSLPLPPSSYRKKYSPVRLASFEQGFHRALILISFCVRRWVQIDSREVRLALPFLSLLINLMFDLTASASPVTLRRYASKLLLVDSRKLRHSDQSVLASLRMISTSSQR